MKEKTVNLSNEAKQHLAEIIRWYESKEKGLSKKFITEFNRLTSYIKENPELFRKIEKDLRRALMGSFPFTIHYEYKLGEVNIFSVFRQSRNQQRDPNEELKVQERLQLLNKIREKQRRNRDVDMER